MGLRDYAVIVLRGHGVKALHVLGLIWLWGYRYIELSGFSIFHSGILRAEFFFCWPVLLLHFFPKYFFWFRLFWMIPYSHFDFSIWSENSSDLIFHSGILRADIFFVGLCYCYIFIPKYFFWLPLFFNDTLFSL